MSVWKRSTSPIFSAFEEDAFLEVHLSPLPLIERLRHAIFYIFGKRSKYGDYEEIVLSPETALELGDRLVSWAQSGNSL